MKSDILFLYSYHSSFAHFPDTWIDICVSYCRALRGYIEAHFRGCEPPMRHENAAPEKVSIPHVRRARNRDKNAVRTRTTPRADALRDKANNARGERTKPGISYTTVVKMAAARSGAVIFWGDDFILYVKKSQGSLHPIRHIYAPYLSSDIFYFSCRAWM